MFPLSTDQAGQPQSGEKKGDPLGALYTLCVIQSNCFIVFLRTGFGREALGMRGLLALILLLLCLGGDPRMIWWVLAYLVAIIIQRIITFRAIRKGAVIHSLYAGTPLLMNFPLIRKSKERNVFVLEGLLCFFLGTLFLAVSKFIGLFMMLGFVTLVIRTGIEESVYKRRLMKMQDAQIEARFYGDSMRR